MVGAPPSQVRAVGDLGRVGQQSVDFSCDVALEAAEDLAVGLALGAPSGGVGLGALVVAEPDCGDAPQGVVGLAVAAAVEPVAHGAARGGLDGADAAQRPRMTLRCAAGRGCRRL